MISLHIAGVREDGKTPPPATEIVVAPLAVTDLDQPCLKRLSQPGPGKPPPAGILKRAVEQRHGLCFEGIVARPNREWREKCA